MIVESSFEGVSSESDVCLVVFIVFGRNGGLVDD